MRTKILLKPAYISSVSSVVGPKEGVGPLGNKFDVVRSDELCGEKTWEQAESRFLSSSMELLLAKAELPLSDVDCVLAGDLLNQTVATSFAAAELDAPLVGLYGACSTFGEGLLVGACFVGGGGVMRNVVVAASSHFCAAEKQFRFPLELGGQRPQTSSWTVTGAGAALVTANKDDSSVGVTGFTPGKAVDLGVKDAQNMGAAMAPAAADTLLTYFRETNTRPNDVDLIVTGDLGKFGSKLLADIVAGEGFDIAGVHTDCGEVMFDPLTQDVHAGGSGCGCAACVFCADIYPDIASGRLGKVLFMPTGALFAPTTSQQGSSIPSVAHLTVIEHMEV